MSSQKNTEEDVISEIAKADKDCKNMVLHKEIADGRASSSNKEHSVRRNAGVSRYRLNRNDHVITPLLTAFICATLTIRNVK